MTHEEMMRRHAEERIPKPDTAAFTLWRGGSLGIPNAFFASIPKSTRLSAKRWEKHKLKWINAANFVRVDCSNPLICMGPGYKT